MRRRLNDSQSAEDKIVTTTMTTMLRPDGVRHVPYALRSHGRNERKMQNWHFCGGGTITSAITRIVTCELLVYYGLNACSCARKSTLHAICLMSYHEIREMPNDSNRSTNSECTASYSISFETMRCHSFGGTIFNFWMCKSWCTDVSNCRANGFWCVSELLPWWAIDTWRQYLLKFQRIQFFPVRLNQWHGFFYTELIGSKPTENLLKLWNGMFSWFSWLPHCVTYFSSNHQMVKCFLPTELNNRT